MRRTRCRGKSERKRRRRKLSFLPFSMMWNSYRNFIPLRKSCHHHLSHHWTFVVVHVVLHSARWKGKGCGKSESSKDLIIHTGQLLVVLSQGHKHLKTVYECEHIRQHYGKKYKGNQKLPHFSIDFILKRKTSTFQLLSGVWKISHKNTETIDRVKRKIMLDLFPILRTEVETEEIDTRHWNREDPGPGSISQCIGCFLKTHRRLWSFSQEHITTSVFPSVIIDCKDCSPCIKSLCSVDGGAGEGKVLLSLVEEVQWLWEFIQRKSPCQGNRLLCTLRTPQTREAGRPSQNKWMPVTDIQKA